MSPNSAKEICVDYPVTFIVKSSLHKIQTSGSNSTQNSSSMIGDLDKA